MFLRAGPAPGNFPGAGGKRNVYFGLAPKQLLRDSRTRKVMMPIRAYFASLFALFAATPAFAQNLEPGVYANDYDSEPRLTLSIQPGGGQIVLTSAYMRENAAWFAYGEYEGRAKPAGKNTWSVAWAKKKATAGNFPLPATTSLSYSSGQYTLTVSGKQLVLKAKSQADLVFQGMYNEPPYAGRDVLFVTENKESFIYVKRLSGGNVQFLSFTRKNPAFVPLKAGPWEVRLTRFLKAENAPRSGTGALVSFQEQSGTLSMHIDGERSPVSDAMLSVMRNGKPPVEYTGQDPVSSWTRKGRPSETAEVYGDFVLWKNAKNPEGVWLQIERAENLEQWKPLAGGGAFTWNQTSTDESKPEEGTLTLADKTQIQFASSPAQ